MPIQFANNEINFKLKNKTKLKEWIKTVVEKEKLILGELSYIFCDDESLLKMNQQFLDHDTYTDIITFDYREEKTVNGEIYISVDRVRENAEKFETTFENELHRVMIHGVLHICGYKDKTKAAKELMRKMEDQSLKKLK
ncbi:MAG TPA: rRNA maturation RNase YbeY [Bacteroidia bacterium]